MEKKMLVLKGSEDIETAELLNIKSQIALYGINSDEYSIKDKSSLIKALRNGSKYDYIYLAAHGCQSSWGNIQGDVEITWLEFAAEICMSEVSNSGAVFLHSCCRGGLNQVAWQMFACCPRIEFVCGPRHDITPVDLLISFNLFLYNIEVKRIDPVRSAQKVLEATDTRLCCFDRVECESEYAYIQYVQSHNDEIEKAFEDDNVLHDSYVEPAMSIATKNIEN